MQSFDSVSIDSDLDSVCTEQIRLYINSQFGECKNMLIRQMSY